MSWAGDWMCGACQHMNFKKRDSCQRCGFSKYVGQANDSTHGYTTTTTTTTTTNNNNSGTRVLAGDWYCQASNCGVHNYASRTSCFKCGAPKIEYATSDSTICSEPVVPGWKTGDWICTRPGCGVHNYASRTACFKCKTPRDVGEML